MGHQPRRRARPRPRRAHPGARLLRQYPPLGEYAAGFGGVVPRRRPGSRQAQARPRARREALAGSWAPAYAGELERLYRLEHLGGVTGHLDLAPRLHDPALLVDEEGRALHAHIFAAVHALLDPGPEGVGDRPIL